MNSDNRRPRFSVVSRRPRFSEVYGTAEKQTPRQPCRAWQWNCFTTLSDPLEMARCLSVSLKMFEGDILCKADLAHFDRLISGLVTDLS
jgi:hypothetical protein